MKILFSCFLYKYFFSPITGEKQQANNGAKSNCHAFGSSRLSDGFTRGHLLEAVTPVITSADPRYGQPRGHGARGAYQSDYRPFGHLCQKSRAPSTSLGSWASDAPRGPAQGTGWLRLHSRPDNGKLPMWMLTQGVFLQEVWQFP